MLALVIEAGGTSTRITSRDDEQDAPGAMAHLLTPNFLLQPDASAASLIQICSNAFVMPLSMCLRVEIPISWFWPIPDRCPTAA